MSFTCIVIDDHLAEAEHIAGYVKRAGLTLLSIETDSTIALQKIRAMEKKPDIIFLDISMSGMSGLEIAEALRDMTSIIFTTAHRHYGPESYKLGAVFYLLKPITYADFLESIAQVKSVFSNGRDDMKYTKEYFSFQGSGKGGIIRVKTDEINFLKSAQHYVEIHCAERQYVIHRSMTAIISDLGGLPFIRVHKSFAVNLHKVVELKDGIIHLSGGFRAELGTAYKSDFLKWL